MAKLVEIAIVKVSGSEKKSIGQISIPLELREKYKIKAGDRLKVYDDPENKRIVLEKM